MTQALVRRLLYGLLLVVAVVILNFVLIKLAPGDAVDAIVGESGGASEEMVQRIRAEYGLDQPVPVQLWRYGSKMLTGDLGRSLHKEEPVLDLILRHLPATALLALSALVLAIVIGTALGVFAASRRQGALNHSVTVLSLLGYATPAFWLGMMVLIVFADMFPIFPSFGMRSVPAPDGWFAQATDVAWHMALPVFTLSILFLASYSRLSRASMLDVLGADYVRTARAKGLLEKTVIWKHALRNAALPVVTMAGLHLGHVLSGAILVETVFSLPGIGPLLHDSILRRDTPVLLGILLVSAIMVVVANIVTDLTYRLVDPRIRAVGG